MGLAAATPLVPEDDRITVYAVSIVIGTVAQLLWLLPSLRGRARLALAWRCAPAVRRVLVLMLPGHARAWG